MAAETVISVGSDRARWLLGLVVALLVGGVGGWVLFADDEADDEAELDEAELDEAELDEAASDPVDDRWLVVLGGETALVADGELRLRGTTDAVVLSGAPDRDGRGLSLGALVIGWDVLFAEGPPEAALTWRGRTGEVGAGVVLFAPTRDDETDEVVFGYAIDDDTVLWGEPAPPRTFLRDVRLFVDAPTLAPDDATPFFCDLGPFVDGIPLDGTVKLSLDGRAPGRDVTVDWGDGTVEQIGAGVTEPRHRYDFEPGSEFTITASGGCVDRERIGFPGPPG